MQWALSMVYHNNMSNRAANFDTTTLTLRLYSQDQLSCTTEAPFFCPLPSPRFRLLFPPDTFPTAKNGTAISTRRRPQGFWTRPRQWLEYCTTRADKIRRNIMLYTNAVGFFQKQLTPLYTMLIYYCYHFPICATTSTF